ncbi:hypothetical protein TNCV_2048301 [Trichonephila clavipes]|nr:hypothetical protein TNCV_2048301 [Trichonephila clavipes]
MTMNQISEEKNVSWRMFSTIFPTQTPLIIRQFLTNNNMVFVHHPPYSSPLIFLFPRMKRSLKGKQFSDVDEVKVPIGFERYPASRVLELF